MMQKATTPELLKCWQARYKIDHCAQCGKEIKLSDRGFEVESVFWQFRTEAVWPESMAEPLYCTKKCALNSLKAGAK